MFWKSKLFGLHHQLNDYAENAKSVSLLLQSLIKLNMTWLNMVKIALN